MDRNDSWCSVTPNFDKDQLWKFCKGDNLMNFESINPLYMNYVALFGRSENSTNQSRANYYLLISICLINLIARIII